MKDEMKAKLALGGRPSIPITLVPASGSGALSR